MKTQVIEEKLKQLILNMPMVGINEINVHSHGFSFETAAGTTVNGTIDDDGKLTHLCDFPHTEPHKVTLEPAIRQMFAA